MYECMRFFFHNVTIYENLETFGLNIQFHDLCFMKLVLKLHVKENILKSERRL